MLVVFFIRIDLDIGEVDDEVEKVGFLLKVFLDLLGSSTRTRRISLVLAG